MKWFFVVYLVVCVVVCREVLLEDWQMTNQQFPNESFPIHLPSTIFNAYIEKGFYPDLFYGLRYKDLDKSRFGGLFTLERKVVLANVEQCVIKIRGLSYSAQLFVNNEMIADFDVLQGTFRTFYIVLPAKYLVFSSVTLKFVLKKAHNRVFPPGNNSTDLGISFIDWAPPPLDDSMGVLFTPTLLINEPIMVYPPSISTSYHPIQSTFRMQVCRRSFYDEVDENELSIKLGERVIGEFHMVGKGKVCIEVENQKLSNDMLWYPFQMGNATLHTLKAELSLPKKDIVIPRSWRVGFRMVESVLTEEGYRQVRVNGQAIFIKGAAWTPKLTLSDTEADIKAVLGRVKEMGLNTVRLEGKFPHKKFYEVADQLGLMLMVGWSCCDAFQHYKSWTREVYEVAMDSLADTVDLVITHPSILMFLYGSDTTPPPSIEDGYLAVLAGKKWPNIALASAANTTSEKTGRTGVKMSGPYMWVPPNYWDEGGVERRLGGSFGFLTEGGPGASMMIRSSLDKITAKIDPVIGNPVLNYHTCNPHGLFRNLTYFEGVVEGRMGPVESVEAYLRYSQWMNYEAQRAMFESYNRNKYRATGIIQWMLNSPWPSNYWNLVDYYGATGGSFYGAKTANRALTPILSYAHPPSIYLTNQRYHAQVTSLTVEVYLPAGMRIYRKVYSKVQIASDQSVRIDELPVDQWGDEPLYFVRLLTPQVDTTYVRPRQGDIIDWERSTFYRTLCKQFADFRGLEKLVGAPTLDLAVKYDRQSLEIEVSNPTSRIAFFCEVRVKEGGKEVNGVVYSDNYFTLYPNTSTVITVRSTTLSPNAKPFISTWNGFHS